MSLPITDELLMPMSCVHSFLCTNKSKITKATMLIYVDCRDSSIAKFRMGGLRTSQVEMYNEATGLKDVGMYFYISFNLELISVLLNSN